MEVPLQVIFHNVDRSDAVEAKVRERAEKLEKYCADIVSCRVAIEMPHSRHSSGNRYRVRVEVGVPGEKLVTGHEPDAHHSYTDVYVAVRDAFDAMQRQLQAHTRRAHGQ